MSLGIGEMSSIPQLYEKIPAHERSPVLESKRSEGYLNSFDGGRE